MGGATRMVPEIAKTDEFKQMMHEENRIGRMRFKALFIDSFSESNRNYRFANRQDAESS